MTEQVNKKSRWAIRELAAECLAQGLNQKETASHVGVTENTISSWLKDSEYLRLVVNKVLYEIRDESRELWRLLRQLKHGANNHLRNSIGTWVEYEKKISRAGDDESYVAYLCEECPFFAAVSEFNPESLTSDGGLEAIVKVDCLNDLYAKFVQILHDMNLETSALISCPKDKQDRDITPQEADAIILCAGERKAREYFNMVLIKKDEADNAYANITITPCSMNTISKYLRKSRSSFAPKCSCAGDSNG